MHFVKTIAWVFTRSNDMISKKNQFKYFWLLLTICLPGDKTEHSRNDNSNTRWQFLIKTFIEK